jgi:hypothetical protein
VVPKREKHIFVWALERNVLTEWMVRWENSFVVHHDKREGGSFRLSTKSAMVFMVVIITRFVFRLERTKEPRRAAATAVVIIVVISRLAIGFSHHVICRLLYFLGSLGAIIIV